jgi:hypothetical protein
MTVAKKPKDQLPDEQRRDNKKAGDQGPNAEHETQALQDASEKMLLRKDRI